VVYKTFEEALKTYSKGSQKKVLWTCPKCKETALRIFKSAVKIKLCKKCSCRKIAKNRDITGVKNPWFGKTPPCVKSGPENPNWNSELSNKERQERKEKRRNETRPYKKWREAVFERDSYTCQKCKSKKSPFNAHHLNSWKLYKSERFDLANGITLCSKCHKDFHGLYGKVTTKEQFEHFRTHQ